MNQFKERRKEERSFYKTYEKGKNGQKYYKGSIIPEQELNTKYSLATVSCFVVNQKGEILVEERSQEKKISPYALDIVSGHIDNNETPTQAMIREYVEELHSGSEEEKQKARNEAIDKLQKLEELHLICEGRGYYVQFYCIMTELEAITRQEEEINNTRWLPMEEVFEMIRQGKTGLLYVRNMEKIFEQVRQRYRPKRENENLLTR